MFILYIACLAYTVTVYWVGETVKKLDLLEVVNATHAEEERLGLFTVAILGPFSGHF